MSNSSSNSISALVPGGVVTTQNISTVIKPKENNNSMQFVKIQTPELSKKAVEQIRVAQESKITKDKIKEVEEEWQSNLLNWKSKRRQQFVGTHSNDNDGRSNNDANENNRKTKTFAEMIEERTKTGNRLNFHLERYIGSNESEQDNQDQTDFVSKEIAQLSLNNNNISDNFSQRSHYIDSPCNNIVDHSSENESNNDINRNYSVDNNNFIFDKDDKTNPTFNDKNGFVAHNGHNGVRKDSIADDDDVDVQPINSTFKQGVEPPPTPPTIHSDDKIRLTLDVDTKTKDISSVARFDDDNGSDHDEEEDEQEEEEKKLQRIAFVTKLKAFEKMTKPSMQEPKFVPPKAAKVAPPPPPPTLSRSSLTPSQHPPTQPSALSPIATPPIQHKPLVQEQVKKERIPQLETPKKTITEMPVQKPEHATLRQPPSQHPVRQKQQNHHIKSSANIQSLQSYEEVPQVQAPPIQTARKQASPITSPTQITLSPATSSPRQEQSRSVQIVQPPFPPQSSTKLANAPLQLRSPIPSPSPQRQPLQKQPQLQSHPQQPPPRQQSQQSQSPHKDDKGQDRTVLSVSGKKKCSSCQEELGRGAAAFVIESLNLVYHTNCFRCSVCHVNLSNGFRGVDVRVHAGALHCQNCYSKDGLNYSRV